MAKEDWSEAKAWMRATRERIGMTQHDAAVLSFSRVSDLPEGLPDWVRAEESVKRRAAAVREAAVLLEAEGVAVDYTYLPEETE